MKLLINSVDGETYGIEVTPAMTIGQLKVKLASRVIDNAVF